MTKHDIDFITHHLKIIQNSQESLRMYLHMHSINPNMDEMMRNITDSKPLDPDLNKIIHDKLWDIYEN